MWLIRSMTSLFNLIVEEEELYYTLWQLVQFEHRWHRAHVTKRLDVCPWRRLLPGGSQTPWPDSWSGRGECCLLFESAELLVWALVTPCARHWEPRGWSPARWWGAQWACPSPCTRCELSRRSHSDDTRRRSGHTFCLNKAPDVLLNYSFVSILVYCLLLISQYTGCV